MRTVFKEWFDPEREFLGHSLSLPAPNEPGHETAIVALAQLFRESHGCDDKKAITISDGAVSWLSVVAQLASEGAEFIAVDCAGKVEDILFWIKFGGTAHGFKIALSASELSIWCELDTPNKQDVARGMLRSLKRLGVTAESLTIQ